MGTVPLKCEILGVISFKSDFQDQPLLTDLLIGLETLCAANHDIGSHFGKNSASQANETSFIIILARRVGIRS